jgi:transposase-like protein
VPAPAAVDPEMTGTIRRRVFGAKEKLRILAAADQAAASGEPGAIGAVLRREGVYSSMLATWRRQRDEGLLQALSPARRGPKTVPVNPLQAEVERLERENRRLKGRLAQAEGIIDLQKKVSELLGIPLRSQSGDESV